jgi:hypothetical protein
VQGLPRRWARNGAIFGAIFGFGKYAGGGLQQIVDIISNRGALVHVLFSALTFILLFGLVGLSLGVWARWSLRVGASEESHLMLKTIIKKWVIGMLIISVGIFISDVALEWRGPMLRAGGSAMAITDNVGYLGAWFGATVVIGYVVALISRRGLKQAILDDKIALNLAASSTSTKSATPSQQSLHK